MTESGDHSSAMGEHFGRLSAKKMPKNAIMGLELVLGETREETMKRTRLFAVILLLICALLLLPVFAACEDDSFPGIYLSTQVTP